jgi:hypothetical protein
MTKKCNICKIEKSISEYFANKQMKDRKSGNCKVCDLIRRNAWRSKNPDRVLIHSWKAYGIKFTLEQYDVMLAAQNGHCAICLSIPGKRRFHVDHCHKTGKVRGLLCFNCNVGIGKFKDDSELIFKVLRYLNGTT